MVCIAVSMHNSPPSSAIPTILFGNYGHKFLRAIGEANRTLLRHAFLVIFEADPAVVEYYHTREEHETIRIDEDTTALVTFEFVDAMKDKFSFRDRCIAATKIYVWREAQFRVKFLPQCGSALKIKV